MAKKTISDSITPQKAFAITIIVVVIIVVFFIFKNQIKGLISSIKTNAETQQALNEEIKSTGQSLSYTESQYKNYATRLYNAMKGWGTDEAAVYAVFNEMNNTADVLKLIVAYGSRDSETLPEWIRGDLSTGEIKKLNQILTAKGINYQF